MAQEDTAQQASGAPMPASETQAWQRALAGAYRDGHSLLAALGLNAEAIGYSEAATKAFPLLATREWVAKMRFGDPCDPLLRQVLPHADEAAVQPGAIQDPLQEHALAQHGLLHKYHGRVLWLLSGGCSVHCRYCFRRHFPYSEHVRPGQWEQNLAYVASDASIQEVIFSGGDPWLLPDAHLARLMQSLETIPHVKTVRWHTRLPLMIPSRVTPAMVGWLSASSKHQVVVLHCNHAQALDAAVADACQRLRHAGVTLLNQAVLLQGINDDVASLAALSWRLFDCGVLPYYLHLLDPVKGAMHFDVPDARARALMSALARRLPGYLLPRCVREVPGKAAKTPLTWSLEMDITNE